MTTAMLVRRLRKGDTVKIGGGDLPEVVIVVRQDPDASLSLNFEAPAGVQIRHEKRAGDAQPTAIRSHLPNDG